MMEDLISTLSKVPFMDLNDIKEYVSLLEILLGPILHEYFPFSAKSLSGTFLTFFAPYDSKRGGVASIILCFMGYSSNFKACLQSPMRETKL